MTNRPSGAGALFILPNNTMGGAEKVLRLVATECAKRGCHGNVSIYVLSGRPPLIDPFTAEGIDIRVLYSGRRRAFQGVPGLIRFIMSRHFSIVMSSHTHVNALTSILRRLSLLRTRFLVARESTMIFERPFSLPKKIALRTMYRFYGAHDRIVCQTEQMRLSLNWHTGGRFSSQTETIGNPICLAEISDSQHHPVGLVLPISAPTLVWCGRFHSIKRPDLAIETLEILRQDEGWVPHLLMLGEGALFAQAKEQVIRLRLESICILAGYHRSPAAVFAAVTGGIGLLTSEMEGFPNVVLEMLAAGIDRVVATPCCAGLADVPGVTISNSSDPQDLAAAIRLSLATPVDRPTIDSHLATRDVTQYVRRIFLHSTS